jgi:hypothetical protein
LFAGHESHLAGLDLGNAVPNFGDLCSLNLWRNTMGELLDKAISKVGTLGRGKLLYLGKNAGNGLSHKRSIYSTLAMASMMIA